MASLRDSELVSRLLAKYRMVVVGSPRYFAKHGRPRHPRDLDKHHAVAFWQNGPRAWLLKDGEVSPKAQLVTNSGDAQVAAAVAGVGLLRMFEFYVRDELARGKLEIVLASHEPPPRPLHALYAKHRAGAPKVRVFLDWLEERLAPV